MGYWGCEAHSLGDSLLCCTACTLQSRLDECSQETLYRKKDLKAGQFMNCCKEIYKGLEYRGREA